MSLYGIPNSRDLFDGVETPQELSERGSLSKNKLSAGELADRREELIEAMTKTTVEGAVGYTMPGGPIDPDRPNNFPIPQIAHNRERANEVSKALGDVEMAKSLPTASPDRGSYGAKSTLLAKEWTLTSPVPTGLGYRAAA